MRPFPTPRRTGAGLLAVLAVVTGTAGCARAVADAGAASGGAPLAPAVPSRYGDDPALDRLWEACEAGSNGACEELYWSSPVGSGYERYSAGG